MENFEAGSVVFVGAGPGGPDFLTLAGARAISEADLVLYAGSLVHPAIIELAGPKAEKRNSANMTLEECVKLMQATVAQGKLVARVHTGDPAIFGALAEQARELTRLGIPWKVIPGVTAATAAAASAGISFTLPELAQGLIVARQPGRTGAPAEMELASLARHHMPMAIYLSGRLVKEMRQELLKSLPPETPVLCARRAGWAEATLLWTTLDNLEQCALRENLLDHTVFLVLPQHCAGRETNSRLYAEDFSHGHRRGQK